jgi:predicted dithiol-disulfide oxidoreductase (DUF899 family)
MRLRRGYLSTPSLTVVLQARFHRGGPTNDPHLPAASTYGRGLDVLWGMYQWLDRAPRGRNETGMWWRRHDEYDKG